MRDSVPAQGFWCSTAAAAGGTRASTGHGADWAPRPPTHRDSAGSITPIVARLANGRLVELDHGGHVLVGNVARLRALLGEFLTDAHV